MSFNVSALNTFRNVNISLRQFQEISSGKYNAGEVKLTSETEIDKVNKKEDFPNAV